MQGRSFIQATPSFSRKGRLRDTASRTAASLTGAGSSARTAALMEPRQNRVAKITRVIVGLTRLTVAPPSQKIVDGGASVGDQEVPASIYRHSTGLSSHVRLAFFKGA